MQLDPYNYIPGLRRQQEVGNLFRLSHHSARWHTGSRWWCSFQDTLFWTDGASCPRYSCASCSCACQEPFLRWAVGTVSFASRIIYRDVLWDWFQIGHRSHMNLWTESGLSFWDSRVLGANNIWVKRVLRNSRLFFFSSFFLCLKYPFNSESWSSTHPTKTTL